MCWPSKRCVEGGTDPHDKIDWIFLRLLARPLALRMNNPWFKVGCSDCSPTTKRTRPMRSNWFRSGNLLETAGIAATELAAWTMLTNELMNLDAVLNK